ncbi:apolipoprotein D-like [Saccoglossus kowalevskii]|uniref:Apolipoprotein D n=1 Tax=Saccoglossus kowalevskii TaxID=10224 RepID=A0ABM0MUY3_SACKO|nr:PREDICTED: apolipoprotein D-like [Saccoglossus kowalevskii]
MEVRGFIILAVSALSLFYSVCGQVISRGSCPTLLVQHDFKLENYTGSWNEIERFPAGFESGLKCLNDKYWLKQDGVIGIIGSWMDAKTGEQASIESVARVPDPNVPAKLKVKLRWWMPEVNYWVLMTDYDTYSIVYSCDDFIFGFFKMELAWILSRDRTLNTGTLTDIKRDVQDRGIDISNFQSSDQTGCEAKDNSVKYKPLNEDPYVKFT